MIQGGTLASRFDVWIANGSNYALEAPVTSLPRLRFLSFVPAEQKAAEVLGAGASRPAARRRAAP